MKQSQTDQSQDDEVDEVLARNFAKLMGDMSVGRLREDMGDIGTSAIQRAKRGSKGLRLETLEKFAEHFKVQPYQMLLPDLGGREMQSARTWPFELLTPDQIQNLSPKQLQMVEKFALDLIEMAYPVAAASPAPNTQPTRSGALKTLELTVKRKPRGTNTEIQARPRKAGGG